MPFLLKSAELIMQEFLEAEVTEHLQRGHYERRCEEGVQGYRNGYERQRIKTAEGQMHIHIPQVRDAEIPYNSKLKEFFRG